MTKIALRVGGVRVRSDRLPGHDPQARSDTEMVPVGGGSDSSGSAPRLKLQRPGEGACSEPVGRPQSELEAAEIQRR